MLCNLFREFGHVAIERLLGPFPRRVQDCAHRGLERLWKKYCKPLTVVSSD